MAFLTLKHVLKQRLYSAINALVDECSNYDATQGNEVQQAKSILAVAKEYTDKGEIDLAWNQYHLAEYHTIRCYSDELRKAKAEVLLIEAPKIGPLRQKMVETILNKKEFDAGTYSSSSYTVDKLLAAAKLRDDFYNTRAHKMAIRQTALNSLAVILLINVVAIIGLCICDDITSGAELWQEILISMLFGVLGAGFSMAQSITSVNVDQKIPEQLLSIFVTIIRLMIGATSALIVLMLFKSGVLKNILSDTLLSSVYAYIILAFLSGFSERWVVKILETVGTINDSKAKA
ncbi:MAG: hypothetical protein U0V74_06945 [Chitinophagales bacterium]